MDDREAFGHLFLVTARLDREGGVDVGRGILDARQAGLLLRAAQRVVGVRVLELHEGTDLARLEVITRFALLAVGEEDLADPLGVAVRGVLEGVAGLELPGIDAEEREGAHVLFDEGLEDEDDGFVVLDIDLDRFSGGRLAGDRLAIERRGAELGDEVHEANDSYIGGSAPVQKRGAEGLTLNGVVQVLRGVLPRSVRLSRRRPRAVSRPTRRRTQ